MAAFDSGYQSLYTELSKTGLSMLNTVDYQSLVCLGVLPAESVLVRMQDSWLQLKRSVLQRFADLRSRAYALEEKQKAQQQTTVDLFNGSNYLQERASLYAAITWAVASGMAAIQTYENEHREYIKQFVRDYVIYWAQNKDLIKNLSTRIAKVQYVTSGFRAIEQQLANIYTAMGITDVMQKYEWLKATALASLHAILDPVVATKLRVNKWLTSLSWTLRAQKDAMITAYGVEMDAQIQKTVQKRYNHAKYLSLQQKITDFNKKYFSNQRLQCTSVIANNDDAKILELTQEMMSLSANIASGIQAASSSGNQSVIKTELINGFKNIFTTAILKNKLTQFQKWIQSTIHQLTQSQTNLVTTGTTEPSGSIATGYILPVGFVFKRPLTLNKPYPEVSVLQKFLANRGLYQWTIGEVFTQSTKDALYAFQLQQWILTSSSNKNLRGLLGPATRASLNKLLQK